MDDEDGRRRWVVNYLHNRHRDPYWLRAPNHSDHHTSWQRRGRIRIGPLWVVACPADMDISPA